jgi:uncharacterized RDD family membrane protein YckC
VPDEAIPIPVGLTTNDLIGRRYLARVIDTLFLGMLVALLLAILGAFFQPSAGGTFNLIRALFSVILVVVIWIGYGTAFESSSRQATPGKRIMGLRVYNFDGGRLKPVQAAGRNAVKDGPFLLVGFIPGGQVLALLWVGAHIFVMHRSPVYQAIHDRALRTWVAAPEETIQLRLT